MPETLGDALRTLEAVLLLGPEFSSPQAFAKAGLHENGASLSRATAGPSPLRLLQLALEDVSNDTGSHTAEALKCCLDAMVEVPFTAVLTSSWSDVLQDYFPRCIGCNFGGFATVLARPRIDKAPGRSRPVMRLDQQGLAPVDEHYLTFLSDLFGSKVVVLAGWPTLPPLGHIGEALRKAWAVARARDASRQLPLSYGLAREGLPEAQRQQCFEEYGLYVLSFSTDSFLTDLEVFFQELSRNISCVRWREEISD